MNYSEDLRKRVVKFVIEENNSKKSKVFDIHYSTVKEWVKLVFVSVIKFSMKVAHNILLL